jgi:crotonobetainyl-CoA:carnitine CoA-transferase CaiB-like acyl-CoA transferase
VVENLPPRVKPGLGISYDILLKVNPLLVMVSISNYGQNGPYRDYEAEEIEAYAMSGLMHMTGDPEKQPLAAGPAVCQYSAGLYAYLSILMSLFHRENAGQGQYIDVSIMECALENIENTLTNYLHSEKNAKRGAHVFAPWGVYACQDGFATVIGAPFRRWRRGSSIFQQPSLLDPAYKHVLGRIKHRRELDDLIKPWLRSRKKKDVFYAGQEQKLAFGYVADLDQVLESPQHRSRQFFEKITHPIVGRHTSCGAPVQLSLTPWLSSRAPLLGEHNPAVYGELLGYTAEEIQRLQEEGII